MPIDPDLEPIHTAFNTRIDTTNTRIDTLEQTVAALEQTPGTPGGMRAPSFFSNDFGN